MCQIALCLYLHMSDPGCHVLTTEQEPQIMAAYETLSGKGCTQDFVLPDVFKLWS